MRPELLAPALPKKKKKKKKKTIKKGWILSMPDRNSAKGCA
jgi:hypothetical protein